MADVIRLVPKAELERLRLIQEARAIYDSIFPPSDLDGEPPHGSARSAQGACESNGNSMRESD
ncbi:hypothetical protein LPJ38_33100 [Bradyrhizobium daqingense]|uniref:Uncharacterized protein n=1 Tax=Bradyrhizobium daqingense TaxID=993502 RepID=A0A562KZ64_9BRAD|nr:hypothetical protein [Bradyrhizobium daqingense]TWI00672.1 hypothetical protein IQ17_04675 [Bradyrhizobium daqingense]UFS88421.1 hypothetical protein LPJ38_33100 [Bradyrhizobium daqingense]